MTYHRHREVTGISSLLAPGVGTDVVPPGVYRCEGAAGGRGGGARCNSARGGAVLVVVQGDGAVTELLRMNN